MRDDAARERHGLVQHGRAERHDVGARLDRRLVGVLVQQRERVHERRGDEVAGIVHPGCLAGLAGSRRQEAAGRVGAGALGAREVEAQLRRARRGPGRRLPPAGVREVPAHAGDAGGLAGARQERVEEVERGADVAGQHPLERGVVGRVILGLRDRHLLEAIVLVVGRARVEVLERRGLGIAHERLVVEHVRRGDVVEPADAVQRGDPQDVERVVAREQRRARRAARAGEHVVERRRAAADRGERVVEDLGQRPAAPVGRPFVRVRSVQYSPR